ncbi:MAG TPA: bifunctional riboflavin kinase/FMN adenylyltransferase [Tepidisphaeraceae bacterium]|nr:bifunctional riboflavin kinase/FMN adenylyltransferase [Tepidisphaeraceae bacterium]
MNLHHGLPGLRRLAAGSVLSIGNFDGVHRGHQALLALARDLRARMTDAPRAVGEVERIIARNDGARTTGDPSGITLSPYTSSRDPHANSAGARIAVVTFEPHPLTVLRPHKTPPRLTSPTAKRELLAAQGVDDLVELAPEPAVLGLTAEQFWAILRDEVRPAHLVEGAEFNFGKGRGGNIARLREWSADSGIELHIVGEVEVPLLDLRLAPVSSTVIRWLLAYGRARDAALCLGWPYALRGEVIKGFQRGRTIGIPTANLKCDAQLIPADGVYAGRCAIDGRSYAAAVSIGTLPTFNNAAFQIEAHLIGFDDDLYGREISVELLDWLREQRKYDGVEPLKAQIARDIADTVARANENNTWPLGAA